MPEPTTNTTNPVKPGPTKRMYMALKIMPDTTPDNRTPCTLYETEYATPEECVKALINSGESKGQFAVIAIIKRIELGTTVVATDVKK